MPTFSTHFDSEDDYLTGCRNVSHCQQQQSYSALRLPGRSNSTYFWNDSLVQTFHTLTILNFDTRFTLRRIISQRGFEHSFHKLVGRWFQSASSFFHLTL